MNFKGIIGNQEVKKYLEKNIKQNNILHSYLFLGTDGIGKKIIAKEFAKAILCLEDKEDSCSCKSCTCFDGNNHPDFYVVEPDAGSIKIAPIREMTEKIIEKPIMSERKVYIIDEFDKMTKEAQNCLLKTLEEPPEFAVIILISSNENLILNTIKSRCMTVKFKNIDDKELLDYAIHNIGYDNVSTNLLKAFDGSIAKAIRLKDNKQRYEDIEKVISDLATKDIIDILLDAKVLYDKENIYDTLDYMVVCLYAKKDENYKYLECIKYVNKCFLRIKSNSNFDMSIDNMLFEMKEEINENRNRS